MTAIESFVKIDTLNDDHHLIIRTHDPKKLKLSFADYGDDLLEDDFPFKALKDPTMAIVQAVRDGIYRGQIIMPTGTGKTLVTTEATRILMNEDGLTRFVITASTISLGQQHVRTFIKRRNEADPNTPFANLKILFISCADDASGDDEAHDFVDAPTTNVFDVINFVRECDRNNYPYLIVCTYHSLHRVLAQVYDTVGVHHQDVTYYDEAHNATNPAWTKTIYTKEGGHLEDDTLYQSKHRFFLTATQRVTWERDEDDNIISGTREVGMDQSRWYGEVLYEMNPNQAVGKGLITPLKFVSSYIKPEYKEMVESCIRRGETLTETLIHQAALMILGLLKVKEEAGTLKTIVYAMAVPHAEELEKKINWGKLLGIKNLKTFVVASDIPGRESSLRRFAEAENALMFNYMVLREGIDVDSVNSTCFLRVIRDTVFVAQGVGRGLRLNPKDREALETGTIEVGNPGGWEKPYGYTILPEALGLDHNKGDVFGRTKEFLEALMLEGYEDMHIYIPQREIIDEGSGNGQQNEREFTKYENIDSTSLSEVVKKLKDQGNSTMEELGRKTMGKKREDLADDDLADFLGFESVI